MHYLIVDGHCDSILEKVNKNRDLRINSKEGHLDFPRLLKSGVGVQFMALYIEDHYKPYNSVIRTLELIDILKTEIKDLDYVKLVKDKNDLNNFSNDELKIILAIEGGEALAGKIEVLRCLYELGVRSLTLTWNQRNEIADGAYEEPNGQGLSSFGRSVVSEMNKLGMLIDVSHLAVNGFWDVIETSQFPIVASHSCCRSLTEHHRNLSDKQLKALAKNGGVIGINYCPDFLNKNPHNADINDVIKHIVHASEIMGTEHVGLGSDFDGIDCTPKGLEDVTKVPNLIVALEREGFTSREIGNIMGNNFLRILKQVLK
ncbi:membrane dipeptidase [Desulfonispora thiosulfatigenes DSM 11270]|uniref:Membrane dipeptidase n=1 Tax=Desulfonispora thiosulfatigenes DSM 11270 TaxID=656914 RepID=A0A1W1VSD5_DESTI|nr:dipeptidase [Desulfonispora thiosulfatigenes]SMB96259.1 membrane dipeptidase [Desulfonispora thiosulfatigenes DSM 11270]